MKGIFRQRILGAVATSLLCIASFKDLTVLMQAQKGVERKQIDEHLSQLAALAESSLAGALQCTYGPAK